MEAIKNKEKNLISKTKQELSEEEFNKLSNPSYDLEKEKEEFKTNILTAYRNLVDILKEYLDMDKEYYNIVALWIIGTYFHKEFPSYPFLYFNAQKGSGKSRAMNLITFTSKDGTMMNSMTEAVLFRTKGTLGIDEYEGMTRKGNENLRELLNSAYKKGIKIKRMKQQKTLEGIKLVVEEFEVYRPILIANIWGMESVLGDRCIPLILEKSHRKEIINLVEIFHEDSKVMETKKLLNQCSLCSFLSFQKAYKKWNSFVKNNYTNYINNINNTNYISYNLLFKSLNLMDLNGRELELSLPLCLVANEISSKILKETTLTLKKIFSDKRAEELVEDRDTSLIDFVSQEPPRTIYQMSHFTEKFKEFLGVSDDWINVKWMGRALKRLNLIKEKRRVGKGVQIELNVEKAQKRIKMFK